MAETTKTITGIVPKGDTDYGDKPHGWIQWKGTNVCIDLHCECGYSGHFDGFFLYYYQCPQCNMKYEVGANIKLIKLSAEDIKYAEENSDFKTCELEFDDF